MWLNGNTDQVDQHDRHNAMQREFRRVSTADDLKILLWQSIVHDAETVHHCLRLGRTKIHNQALQAERDQYDRKPDDAKTLNQVRVIGRFQPARHAVQQHDNADHWNQQILNGNAGPH